MAVSQVALAPLLDDVSWNLYSATTTLVPSGNFMISPVSILYATVLVYLGARGNTKSNIHSSLHFSKAFETVDSDVSSAFGNLMSMYENSSVSVSEEEGTGDPFQLKVANGIFLQDGLAVSQKYLDQAKNKLKAGAKNEDFAGNPETARKHVNTWVEEKTGQKIKDLIPSGAINRLTKAIIANAVYFKATWLESFRERFTKDQPFYLLNGTEKTVKLMQLKKKGLQYVEDAGLGVQYLEIPYYDRQASMLVILPKEKAGLRNLEKSLSVEKLQDLAKSAKETEVNIILPKFKMENTFDMKKMLTKIGVTEIFAASADLRDMIPGGEVFVSDGFHKTFISVDEKGTEAGAASAASVQSRKLTTAVEFRADHPFMFAIRHDPSKTILFVGRVEEP